MMMDITPGEGASAGGTQSSSGGGNGDVTKKVNYDADEKACMEFLETFASSAGDGTGFKYRDQLQDIANRRSKILEIDLNDMLGWKGDELLVEKIMTNTKRYISLLHKAVDKLMPEPNTVEGLAAVEQENALGDDLASEVLRRQRINGHNADTTTGQEQGDLPDAQRALPDELTRRYSIHIKPLTKVKSLALRQVKASNIGEYVRIQGIVTRVTDVKPLMTVATYACDGCGNEIYQEVPTKSFQPIASCPTAQCQDNGNSSGKSLIMQPRRSKFVKYQEIKLQEMPHQVPIGHIPRTATIQVRGENTRVCKPGDDVTVSGVFLPERISPYQQMQQGLVATTFIECLHIERHKKNYADLDNELSAEMEEKIDAESEDPTIYAKLARSLAPEIFGHEDVKKALLLQLVGGATRKLADGMSIRGDINICLMGDPGVAKSQLLKHITKVAPRCVYTTGKGSSGVGLTAAVVRDKLTGEMALEGGALVLADNGICCIDEFDKMEDADRTAIHEVMEQQTVSIAKAGVTTTLNARTSILAAANPIYGRYNRRYSPSENINLPAALLSRFDLMFLLLDMANEENDLALANHVTHVHMHKTHPELDFEPLSPAFIRAYISQAKKVEPFIPRHLESMIVEQYVSMRQEDANDAVEANTQSMVTARQLLSILRMAQALARLRFDEQVSHADVTEAIRLMRASKSSLEEEEEQGTQHADVMTRIYCIVRNMLSASEKGEIKYADLEPQVLAKGFTAQHLERCLDEYEQLNVIHINAAKTKITLVET